MAVARAGAQPLSSKPGCCQPAASTSLAFQLASVERTVAALPSCVTRSLPMKPAGDGVPVSCVRRFLSWTATVLAPALSSLATSTDCAFCQASRSPSRRSCVSATSVPLT